MNRRQLIQSVAALGLAPVASRAQSAAVKPLKLGALLDLSGPYADVGGKTHSVALKLAVEDFGPKVLGRPIELLIADFQQKVDVSLTIARDWLDNAGVDVLLDAPNSSVALALQTLVAQRNKVYITGAFAAGLTGKDCTQNIVRFGPNSTPLGRVPATELVKQGKKTWFFVTVDYALGHSIEASAIEAVNQNGGKVLGSVRHPFGTTDYSSFLLQAQASNAEVIAFSSAGSDLDNALKQAREFGLEKSHTISTLDLQFLGVPSSGLDLLQGSYVADMFYWEETPAAKAFSTRFAAAANGTHPGSSDMGMYAGLLHTLKAIQAVGASTDGRAIVSKMIETPLNGIYAPGSRIRLGGQLETPIYLFQVKTPAESKATWDVYRQVGTVTGDAAWGPAPTVACKSI